MLLMKFSACIYNVGMVCMIHQLTWRQFGLAVSGNALVSINEVTLHGARLVLGWVTVSGVQLPVRENLSQYSTSHPAKLDAFECVKAI